MSSRAREPDAAALRVDYLSRAELKSQPASWWRGVLGVVPFGATPAPRTTDDIPLVPVGLEVLGSEDLACEVWQLDAALISGRTGEVHYRRGSEVLFGHVMIPEADFEATHGNQAEKLQRVTARAYAEIFAALRTLGCPHLLRVWNYLASINEEDALGERYRQFNSARRAAFLLGRRAVEGDVPAACALGSAPGSPLVIYFLASTARARALENPRQVSAYRYPSEYGPASPTFSRAAIAAPTVGRQLFISGTASILGHESVHPGDAAAQARESAANVAALIEAANAASTGVRYSAEALKYKVYVRHASDFAAIREEFSRHLGSRHPITYLQADICRRELLVEIEAVGGPDRVDRAGRP